MSVKVITKLLPLNRGRAAPDAILMYCSKTTFVIHAILVHGTDYNVTVTLPVT